MEEGEVKLNLNVLDLPGFGDEIDNSRCLESPSASKMDPRHDTEQVLASPGSIH